MTYSESAPVESLRIATDCSVCLCPPPDKPEFFVQGFSVVRCPGCGVLRISPRLGDAALRDYYAQSYWVSTDSVVCGYFDYPGDEENIRRTFRRRLRWLSRWIYPPGALLDVGCACGFLLTEAQALGWKTAGVEWSDYAVSRAPDAARTLIRVGALVDVPFAECSFDLVTMWDYLEHSSDPRADLIRVHDLLKKDGWLSIIIPDAGSWLARVMGTRWEEFKKPQEHLYFFTGRQLSELLHRIGFHVVARQHAGKYATLDFAFSRFKPGDGLIYPLMSTVGRIVRRLGLAGRIVYINPRDKLHLVCRKC